MRSTPAKIALIAPFFALLTYTAEADNGLVEYKAANYKVAIPLLQTAARTNTKDPLISAALLSALVYEGRVEEASDAAEADETQFPTSPEVIAARGEFAFYMGDMQKAECLFKAAMKLKEGTLGPSTVCLVSFAWHPFIGLRDCCVSKHTRSIPTMPSSRAPGCVI